MGAFNGASSRISLVENEDEWKMKEKWRMK